MTFKIFYLFQWIFQLILSVFDHILQNIKLGNPTQGAIREKCALFCGHGHPIQ